MTSDWVRVASRQAGVITTAQLLDSGLLPRQLRGLAATEAIDHRGRGVWVASASSPSWDQSIWLELLAAGPESFAFRRTAAALLGLDGAGGGWVEVAVPHHRRARSAGVTRLRSISTSDLTVVRGMRTTDAVRTLVDLSAVCETCVAERALESALRRRLTDETELWRRTAGVRSAGASRLRAVLRSRPPGSPPTGSDAETQFLQLARSMGLPDPVRQFVVILRGKKYRIDFAWPHLRLAVEIDGAATHGPDRFDADIIRQNSIALDGWTVLRFSWHSVARRPAIVERDLRAAWIHLGARPTW